MSLLISSSPPHRPHTLPPLDTFQMDRESTFHIFSQPFFSFFHFIREGGRWKSHWDMEVRWEGLQKVMWQAAGASRFSFLSFDIVKWQRRQASKGSVCVQGKGREGRRRMRDRFFLPFIHDTTTESHRAGGEEAIQTQTQTHTHTQTHPNLWICLERPKLPCHERYEMKWMSFKLK